ncbi:GEVED domain-containing protein, partial [Chryseobacterium gwangjuense]|uniref:GEVED domain-containing protein n=1 Tax=Chryseobacterium gwangjuense TaxID=1069980 RepID=UPI001E5FFA18
MNVFLPCKTKKFLRNLIALFCMVFGLFAQAQTVTIGTGTATQRYPLGSYYAYEMSASLYTAAEINLPAGGSVQSVAWNCTAAMSFNLPIKIYLKSVPSTTTTFTAQPWTTVKSGAVLVYDGTVSNLPVGWNTITLQNPYYYNGTDNLQVLVETNFGGTTGGTTSTTGSAITYSTATTQHMYYYSNNAQQATNGYTSSSRPNIRLTFGAAPACIPPPSGSGLTISTLTATSAGISWTAPTTAPAGGYDVYYTTSTAIPTSTTTPSQTVTTGTSATLSPLTANTTYYAWVRSKCSGTSQSSWVGPLVIYTAYCLPSAGTSSTTYYLSKILTTGGWTNINYTASSYTAYVNNSSNTLSTSPGSAIGVSLAAGTSTYYYYVWVDWNNDMDFNDAGETVLATTTYAATGTTTINVPAAQPYGNYRVRFGLSFSGAITSCGAAPYGNYVDYTLAVGAPPTCMPPTALVLNSATTSSASIGWTASTTPPALGYEIYYNTTNIAPTSGTTPQITGVTGTTATIPGLAINTTYYIWVRAKCSTSDQSPWSGPITVFTNYCSPTAGTSSTTYYLSKILTTGGWTNINYTASSYTAYVNNSSNTLSTSPGSAIGVSLAAGTSTYYYYVWVDWNNDMDFNDPGETILATTSYATTASTTINVPAAQPYGNYRVRFGMSFSGAVTACGPAPYGNYVDYTLAVGAPPTCMPPTALVLNSATISSASIGWTASTTNPALGYEIYYNTTNIAPTSGTTPQITGVMGTTATIPGLTINTTYYIWVRAKCSTSDQSPWSGPITVFTNYCAPTGGSSSTTYYLNNVTTTGGWTNLGYTASSYNQYVNSNMSVLSSPGSSVVMNLATAGGSTYYYYVWIDWNNDMDFNDPGETILATTSYAATGTATINIPAGQALGNYRMRCASSFIGAITPCGPAPYGAYVDFTLAVVTPPTCLPPTGMTVTGVTGNGAVINWATPATPPALGYAYYVSTTPVQPGTPTGTTTATSVNLTPTLLPSTTYYWWVKAICSSTDNSYVAQGPSFMTTQIPAVLPYLQNFETANDMGLLNGTQTNKWFHGSVTGNTGKSIYITNDSGVTNAYTITSASVVQAYRDITIPAGTSLATFSFDWKAQGESSWDYVRVWLVPATFMPTPGTQIAAGTGRVQIGQYNQNGTAWQSYSNANLNLSSFAGTVMRLVFEWRNDTTGGTQPPAAIDNIVLRVCSTATPTVTVTPASITHNSATITWPQDIGGASYKVRYRPVGSTQWLPTAGPIDVAAITGTTQTFTLNPPTYPLTPATLYEVEVAAVCNTINVGVYSHSEFTTKCDPTPPNVTFTNITSTSAVVNWSPLAVSATYQMQW